MVNSNCDNNFLIPAGFKFKIQRMIPDELGWRHCWFLSGDDRRGCDDQGGGGGGGGARHGGDWAESGGKKAAPGRVRHLAGHGIEGDEVI